MFLPQFSSLTMRTLLSLAGLALLAGCSNAVEMTLRSTPDLNNGGNAASVRIYQLSSDANFKRAPLEVFWRDDTKALSNELVGTKREVLLYPNEERVVKIEVREDTNFIGIAADLRLPEEDQWRTIYPIDKLEGEAVTVTVASAKLSVKID